MEKRITTRDKKYAEVTKRLHLGGVFGGLLKCSCGEYVKTIVKRDFPFFWKKTYTVIIKRSLTDMNDELSLLENTQKFEEAAKLRDEIKLMEK